MKREQLDARKGFSVRREYPNEPCYQESLIGPICFSDCDGLRKIHSDVHLLLRDKNLASRVGPDVLREYVDGIIRDVSGSNALTEGLNDDQLMGIITDRRLTDATDLYQLSKSIEHQYDSIKSEIENYKVSKEKLDKEKQELLSKLKSN